MKFHISGKIGIPVGIVILIIGGFVFVSAFGNFEETGDPTNWMSEPSSEITKEFTDDDDGGSAGWYIMIQAEYFIDVNEDNMTDACDDLNLTITDSQGNDMNSTSGNIYCELNDNKKMAGLDENNVDIKDGWMIVGIFCDTLDNAEMNGYWETDRNENGEEGEKWVQTGENDRCVIGEKYTISSNQEMVLFDRDAQAGLELRGIIALCGGLCCMICSLAMIVTSVISGFAMKPGNSAFTTMELGGASPVPVSGEGTVIPGTTQGAVFGAGPAAQPMAVPLAEESKEKPVESSADALKKQFLAAADKITESEEPEKE